MIGIPRSRFGVWSTDHVRKYQARRVVLRDAQDDTTSLAQLQGAVGTSTGSGVVFPMGLPSTMSVLP